jgi:MarR family transcriptional regulator, transcriptional regulator for hemolysin
MDKLRNFGFLLKDVSRRYVLRFEQRARAISLTLPQCRALVRLENNEGISQGKLAELVDVDAMTMVRIIDRMEDDGLLERRADPEDRRARRLYLTGKAKPLLKQIWRLAELTRAETFSGITAKERDAFMAVLEHMHRNVCACDDGPIEAAQAATPNEAGARSPRKPRTRS